ncbi:MAG: HEAT repeat domain-containing protein [Deltaproteobacteria bacterium]|nr:HEAT repeat domain-containing protein [Deltaproteobacteria bacterium]
MHIVRGQIISGATVNSNLRARRVTRKGIILKLLRSGDYHKAVTKLRDLPHSQAINSLLSFLYHGDETVKWTAVSVIGMTVLSLADADMERARNILRRLMWNLNDESGGIGWGSPEAMGEILANHQGLAKEYAHILISYAREDGNYLEDERLQRGLLWAIGRLAQNRPALMEGAKGLLLPYLRSPDPFVRGYSAWVTGLLRVQEAKRDLEGLLDDDRMIKVYINHKLLKRGVMDLAKEALERLSV